VAVKALSRTVAGTFLAGFCYGVGVEAVSGEVLIDAATGRNRTRFTAGVISGSIAFER
jgi:hypothetical protein